MTKSQRLPLSTAWKSYQSAWQLAKPQWGSMIILSFVLFLVVLAPKEVPYVGLDLSIFLFAFLMAGVLVAFNELSHGRQISLDTLFSTLISASTLRSILPIACLAVAITRLSITGPSGFILQTLIPAVVWILLVIATSYVLFDKLSFLRACQLSVRAFVKNIIVIVLWLCIPLAVLSAIGGLFLALDVGLASPSHWWPFAAGKTSTISMVLLMAVPFVILLAVLHLAFVIFAGSGYLLTRAIAQNSQEALSTEIPDQR